MIYKIINRLGEINWSALKPGDEVHVPYRPAPYFERVVIPCAGTSAAWVKIVGAPDPATGALPVIDGTNAVTDPQFALGYPPIETGGLVSIWRTKASGNTTPAYIEISNLEIRNAGSGTFSGADGNVQPWGVGANGIYALLVDHLTIRGCTIHDCGQGVFVGDSQPCNDVLLDGNHIYGNGVVANYLMHGSYVQSAGATYRNNHWGANRPGAYGGSLKDRSADVLIENNLIEANARCIDLSGWQNDTTLRASRPNAICSIIRNNTLIDRTGANIVYVEGRALTDGTNDQITFDNNTVVVRSDQKTSYYDRLFNVEYDKLSEIAATGNLIDVASLTPGAPISEFRVFDCKGSLSLGKNWSRLALSTYALVPADRTLTGVENVVVGGVAAGYRDEANGDYSLAPGAPATGYGATTVAPPPPPPIPPPPPVWVLSSSGTVEDGDVRVVTAVYRRPSQQGAV